MTIYRKSFLTLTLTLLVLIASDAAAQFQMNFERFNGVGGTTAHGIPGGMWLDCAGSGARLGESCRRGDEAWDPDTSPTLMEMVRGDNGNVYYHMVIGAESEGFVQEYFIRAGWGYPWDQTTVGSASDGTYNGGRDFHANNATWYLPTHRNRAGNGTGNPNEVIFRQKVTGRGRFVQEVTKGQFNRKPKVFQRFNTGGVYTSFNADMSNSSYSDSGTRGSMQNVVRVRDLESNELFTDFNIWRADEMGINDSSPGIDVNRRIAAGRYTYSGGVRFKRSSGNYSYANSGAIDQKNFNWDLFYDNRQNVSNW